MLTLNPFGLAPFAHPSGILRPDIYPATIASGLATNIFLNSPIQIDPSTPAGNLILATALGSAANTPGVTNRLLGTFQGVEFTLTATGRRTVSNTWPASTVATNIVAWHTRDPNMYYRIQANGSVAATAIGGQASISTNGSTNGNTTTGFSTVSLDVTTSGSFTQTGTNQLRIIAFDPDINNTPGDAFTSVIVEINLHQDRPSQVAY